MISRRVVLDTVIDSNEFVLLDTSARKYHIDCPQRFSTYLRDRQEYEKIDPAVIKKEGEGLDDFMLLLYQPSTYTISQVTLECQTFYEKLEQTFSRFPKPKTTKAKSIRKSSALLLKKLQLVIRASEENELEKRLIINDPRFKLLGDIVVLLSKRLGLKKDTHLCMGGERGKDYVPPQTDERLIGAAYWLSTMGVQPTIITKDKDFLTLLEQTPHWIGSKFFMPYNQIFRIGFVQHPPVLCLGDQCDRYKEFSIGSRDLRFFPDNLPASGIPAHTVRELKIKIGDYLREFSEHP